MKAEYINPRIIVKEIQLAQMIALSIDPENPADPDEPVLGKELDQGDEWTKGGNIWED
jgi:hypothetical protein